MATNPMQRKSRNSFILGVFITILIMGAILAFVIMQLIKMKNQEDARIANQKTAYVLVKDVKSGDSITSSSVKAVVVDQSAVPSDAKPSSALPIDGETEEKELIAKIDMKAGTMITNAMLTEVDNIITPDLRLQEYNMLKLATQITTGDYVDVRLRLSNGLDYIVLTKKKVELPMIDGIESASTIWLNLTENETLLMGNAIVEAYQMDGAVLYTTKYIEPGTQDKATSTYVPSDRIMNLILTDPNIVNEARQEIYNRYRSTDANPRNEIKEELNLAGDEDERNEKVSSGVATDVTTTTEERKSYLDALSGQ